MPIVLPIHEPAGPSETVTETRIDTNECLCCDIDTDGLRVTTDNNPLCAACADCHYSLCSVCCAYTGQTFATDYNSMVCRRCADSFRECEDCVVLISHGRLCSGCDHDDDPDDEDSGDYDDPCLIRQWDYRPVFRFHGDGPLYLGLELEINTPDQASCAEVVSSWLGEVGYLKHDSTIDDGFEMVTHPMSYAWAMRHFPWGSLDQLTEEGCTGYGNGLHVHISRAGFSSPVHVFRWMKFIYRNPDQVSQVARRRDSKWAGFDPAARKGVKEFAKGAKDPHRYRAINTQNDATFELRVFASTLDRQQVQAALGLAAASVEYTRDLTVADIAVGDGWSWSAFERWLRTRPEYAPLRRELEDLACAC